MVLFPVLGASIVITLMALGIVELSGVAPPGTVKRIIAPTLLGVITFILAIALVASNLGA